MLGKVAEGRAFLKGHFPGVGRQFAYNNFKQGRFSGTINAYNGSFFIVINVKGNPVQDFLFTKAFCNVVTCKYHKILFLFFRLGIVRVDGKTNLVDTVFIHSQYLVSTSAFRYAFTLGWKVVKQVDDVTGNGVIVFGF